MRGKTYCDNGPFIIPRDLERGASPLLQAGQPAAAEVFYGMKKVNWATKKRHKHKLFSRPCPQCPASGRPPFPNSLSPTSSQTLLPPPPPPSSSCFKASLLLVSFRFCWSCISLSPPFAPFSLRRRRYLHPPPPPLRRRGRVRYRLS